MLLYVNVSTFLRRKLCCCSSSELILTCFFLPCFITAANSAGFWRNLPSATSNKQHENCDFRLLLKGQTSACPAHKRINSTSCCFSKTNSARSYTKPKQTVSCFTNEKPREKRGKKRHICNNLYNVQLSNSSHSKIAACFFNVWNFFPFSLAGIIKTGIIKPLECLIWARTG